MKNFLNFFLTIVWIIPGCTSDSGKVSETAIRDYVENEGTRISMETQQLLGATLKKTIEQKGIPEALKYCNLHAYPLVDSIMGRYSVTIKRASMDTRNPSDIPDQDEMRIIKAYRDSLSSGKTPAVFVEVSDKEVHYARPILLNDNVCLNCHGKVGTEISNENYQVIKALYPEDQATGHALGDLRGIWSIRFKKPDVIQALEEESSSSN